MMLGIHVSKLSKTDNKAVSKELHDAVRDDVELLGINAVQIFTYGPQYYVRNNINYDLMKEVTKDVDLTVHSAYVTTSIWRVNRENKNTPDSKKRISMVYSQLKSCSEIGAWGLVIHITKVKAEVIAETMKILKPYAKKSGVKILLEMTASKSTHNTTYETPEKLNHLITLIGPLEDWFGICVDSAHIWAAGVDIQSYANMKDWFDSLAFKKKILLFHLNGNSSARFSGKDKHEIVFGPDDKIWHGIKPNNSGVKAIVEFCNEYSIPMICEINRGSDKNTIKSLETIKSILD